MIRAVTLLSALLSVAYARIDEQSVLEHSKLVSLAAEGTLLPGPMSVHPVSPTALGESTGESESPDSTGEDEHSVGIDSVISFDEQRSLRGLAATSKRPTAAITSRPTNKPSTKKPIATPTSRPSRSPTAKVTRAPTRSANDILYTGKSKFRIQLYNYSRNKTNSW